jgi:hypothetical protein
MVGWDLKLFPERSMYLLFIILRCTKKAKS